MAKVGRPTKYKESYPQELIDYVSVEPYYYRTVKHTNKKGEVYETETKEPNDLRLIVDFARKVGVSTSQIYSWAKKYPEFQQSLKEAKKIQERHLMTNALCGLFNSTFSIFAAKNMFGWRDKQELEHSAAGDLAQLFRGSDVPTQQRANSPADIRSDSTKK